MPVDEDGRPYIVTDDGMTVYIDQNVPVKEMKEHDLERLADTGSAIAQEERRRREERRHQRELGLYLQERRRDY